MDIKTYVKRVDCSLPIFADFFLKKHKSLVINHPEKAKEIEKYVFKRPFLLDILKGSDFLLKISMLKTVPSYLFSGIIDELIDVFETGGLGGIRFNVIARIINEHKPDQIEAMIQKESAAIKEGQEYDHKFYWIGYSEYFSVKEQERLFQDSVSAYYTHENKIRENRSGHGILSGLVKTGLRLGHPQTIPLAKHFLEYLLDQADLDEFRFEKLCIDFLAAMTDDPFELDLYFSIECKEFDEVPKCLGGIYKDPAGGRQLFQDFQDLIDGKIDSRAMVLSRLDKMDNDILASLIRILLDDKALKKRLDEVETYHELLAVFLSIIRQHNRKGTLDSNFCSDENIRECILFDSRHNPFTGHIKDYLSDLGIKPAGKILNALLDGFTGKENDQVYLICNILDYMDHLKDPSFIPALFKALVHGCEKKDKYIIEASRLALIHLEDEAIDYIADRMDELDDCLLEVMDIIRDIGSTKAEDLLIGNFNRFYNYEKIETLDTCEVLLSHNALQLLDQKIGKNQQQIDRLFLLVTMLNGIEDERIEDVFQSHLDRQESNPEIMNQIMGKGALKSLTLELECLNCHDISAYECSNIYFSEHKTPFIADELTCIACNEISEFQATPNGNLLVQMELVRLMTRDTSEEQNRDPFENSAIKIQNFATKGKAMSLPDGIALYKQDIAKNPKDPSNYIGLGNIYKHIGRFAAAKKAYEKAVKYGSCYIEAYMSLANILKEEGDARGALTWLEKGRPFLKRPIICKNIQISAEDIYDHYLDEHYRLVTETKNNIKPIKPSECIAPGKKLAKIGKNEKCPCGSGKKYKKCCMKNR